MVDCAEVFQSCSALHALACTRSQHHLTFMWIFFRSLHPWIRSRGEEFTSLGCFSLEICTGFPDPVENRLGVLLLSEPAAALELDPEDRNSPALASFSLEICTGFPDPVENRLGVLLLSEPAAALELDPEDRNSPALASFSLEICTGFPDPVENRLGVLLLSYRWFPAAALELDPKIEDSPALASFSLEICTGFPDPVENRLGVLLLSEPAAALGSIRRIEIHQPWLAFLWKYAQAFQTQWKTG